jgi:hypothetical protein
MGSWLTGRRATGGAREGPVHGTLAEAGSD